MLRDDPHTPFGDKGALVDRCGKDCLVNFRSGLRPVRRELLSKHNHRLGGGHMTDDVVFALDTSDDWRRGDKGVVLGSKTQGTLWVQFKHKEVSMPFGSVGKKRPRSPSPSIDESEMPDPKILEQDFRKKTGLLVRHFNPEYHNSYTSRTVKKMKRMRSGEGFIPPLGYTKLALNVEGKFPDDGWLDKKNGWHVVYHGTRCRPCIIKSIVLEGFKIKGGKKEAANGTLFGEGVYCTPNPEKAEKYAKEQPFVDRDDDEYVLLFLCRVRPGAYEVHSTKHWLVKDPNDIRPYGVLLKC